MAGKAKLRNPVRRAVQLFIMILLYRDKPIFVYCFNHQLGSVERDLSQLKAEKLLLGSVDALSAIGYGHNLGVGRNETL